MGRNLFYTSCIRPLCPPPLEYLVFHCSPPFALCWSSPFVRTYSIRLSAYAYTTQRFRWLLFLCLSIPSTSAFHLSEPSHLTQTSYPFTTPWLVWCVIPFSPEYPPSLFQPFEIIHTSVTSFGRRPSSVGIVQEALSSFPSVSCVDECLACWRMGWGERCCGLKGERCWRGSAAGSSECRVYKGEALVWLP